MKKNSVKCSLIFLMFALSGYSKNFLPCGIEKQQKIINGVVYEEKTSEPLLGATVSIKYTSKGVTTGMDGRFVIDANIGDVLVISYIGFETKEVLIETLKTYEIYLSSGISLSEVTLVGRGKPRSQMETAVPIDVIGAKQLQTTPQTELAQVLQYVAPSFHSTKQNIGHGSDHIDPMSLRGLGADQTLVLINGKRRHSSSLMNVNGTVARG